MQQKRGIEHEQLENFEVKKVVQKGRHERILLEYDQENRYTIDQGRDKQHSEHVDVQSHGNKAIR